MSQERTVGHETCHHTAYQMNCAEFDQLLARAEGRCEICSAVGTETAKGKLVIDHQHGMPLGLGAVRGLLCMSCNWILGKVDEGQREPTEAAAAYLANAWHVTRPAMWSNRKRHPDAGKQGMRAVFRYPRADWQRFHEVAAEAGMNASEALRGFIMWYLGQPGAKAPKRPPAKPAA